MGTHVVLTDEEKVDFERKLKELRDRFWVKGLSRISRVGLSKIKLWPGPFIQLTYREPTSNEEAEAADTSINFLASCLGDEANLRELAAIGPCVFHLDWEEVSEINAPVLITIENYILDSAPNMNWSLGSNPEGLRFTS